MSALVPLADISRTSCHVRFVPIASFRAAIDGILFDHLVGACEQRGWHVEAERPGRAEVDHQLKSGRPLDRHISGLLSKSSWLGESVEKARLEHPTIRSLILHAV